MIDIKVYQNGYEIKGHTEEKICHQVSMWHWVVSNLILGLDSSSREYTSHRDNSSNPNEGYTWVTFNPDINNLKWIVEDFIISLERWAIEYPYGNQVKIKKIDDSLVK